MYLHPFKIGWTMNMDSLEQLKERAKELQCIYRVTEALKETKKRTGRIVYDVLNIIPDGWQYPGICSAKIYLENKTYTLPAFAESKWFQSADIIVDNNIIGEIKVYYQDNLGLSNPFLPEEQQLLNAIASRLSDYIFQKRLVKTLYYIKEEKNGQVNDSPYLKTSSDEHWKWRMKMAGKIAEKTNLKLFGIEAIYIIGSVKEATAGPGSDIDLLVHFIGNESQKREYLSWVDGWSHALAELNRQKTGYIHKNGLIDVHLVTDKDIENKTCYAVMINSLHNSARLLRKKE